MSWLPLTYSLTAGGIRRKGDPSGNARLPTGHRVLGMASLCPLRRPPSPAAGSGGPEEGLYSSGYNDSWEIVCVKGVTTIVDTNDAVGFAAAGAVSSARWRAARGLCNRDLSRRWSGGKETNER